jgi:hypothetical protein
MKANLLKRMGALDMPLSYVLCALICVFSFAVNSSPDVQVYYGDTYYVVHYLYDSGGYGVYAAVYSESFSGDLVFTQATLQSPNGTSYSGDCGYNYSTSCQALSGYYPKVGGVYHLESDTYIYSATSWYYSHLSSSLDLSQVSVGYFYASPNRIPGGGVTTLYYAGSWNATNASINGTPVSPSLSFRVTRRFFNNKCTRTPN